tara:strand:- start:222 stop:518 length:297 start_codon:yes stop_codon:yes gene_type:complete
MIQKSHILSLDFCKKKTPNVNLKYFKNRTIILMFIDQVGARGVNWKEIKNINRLNVVKKNNCYIAGGIRYYGEVRNINRMGFKGCIVSSIVHERLKRG